MTSRERVLKSLNHQEPDKVPIAPRMHLWSTEVYGDYNWLRQLKLQNEFGMDPLIEVSFHSPAYIRQPFSGDYTDLDGVAVDIQVENNGDINRVERTFQTPGGILHDVIDLPHRRSRYGLSPSPIIHEPLVKNAEDVDRLPFILPDPSKFNKQNFPEMIEMIGERGLLEVHPTPGQSAPTMSSAMGMENAMTSFYENRELFDKVLYVFAEGHQKITRAILEAGAPLVFMSWHDFGVSGGW